MSSIYSKLYRKISLLLLFSIASLYICAQTADEVINKYVEFIGGQKQWKQVNTIVTSGEYNYGGI